MRNTWIIALAFAGLTVATNVSAQWDAPSFLAPRPGEDLGVYLSTQGDFAVEGIWRQRGSLNLGVRLGYVDSANGRVLVGGETWGPLLSAGPSFPLDASWTFGVGALIGDVSDLDIPVGLTVGRTFAADPMTIQVYGHPRVAVVVNGDPGPGQDDVELQGRFDIGADALLNRTLKLRVGVTFGQSDALGVGLAWAVGRGVVVR